VLTAAWLQAQYERRIAEVLAMPGDRSPVRAIAVVRDLDLAMFVRSAIEFSTGLPAEVASAWHRSFTRTIFLAGDPANLTERHPPAHLAADGAIAWYAPEHPDAYEGLRRLLRPLRGSSGVERSDSVLRVSVAPNGPRQAEMVVAIDGVSLEELLVHVNHLTAEAALTGVLDDVCAIDVRIVDRIEAIDGTCLASRIAPESPENATLRCFAYLRARSRAALPDRNQPPATYSVGSALGAQLPAEAGAMR
jgi:hypothetical protein